MLTLKKTDRIVVLTGAGISAESGIPTFRDAMEGLWSEFDPEELATLSAFKRNPKLVLDWYEWRIKAFVDKAIPNPAHQTLVKWEEYFENFTLITQNVDGLHIKAGNKNVIEFHGNIKRMKCLGHNHKFAWVRKGEEIPLCSVCNSMLRPDVVFFNEMIDPNNLQAANKAVRNCDVFFAIGTSGMVYPAAGYLEEAQILGAKTYVVNTEHHFPASKRDSTVFLRGKAGEILPKIALS
ncbi:MAG: NAD-dependent deacylase [Proteobacteria bacterium]|nr:MAG: NAD-dependent deacylase [Pseudomonadota bacterium]